MSGRSFLFLVAMLSVGCLTLPALQQSDQPAPQNSPAPRAPALTPGGSQPDQSHKDRPATPARATKKRRAPKRVPAPEAQGSPTKVVIREGGVDEPTAQIVTGMSPDEAARQRQEAEQLLAMTGEMLKEIAPRELDVHQQEMVSQIHNYMNLARDALKEGDIPRAHTVAQKANLLADDLRRH
ncbi:MAG TPA: hypothetical protein VMI10_05605 [Terriglobales bacterium]|nr:hypothetical protein [Terriglobales bacterium]